MYLSSQLFFEAPRKTLKFKEKSKPEKGSEETLSEMRFFSDLET